MAQTSIDLQVLRQTLKEVLIETLHEQRPLLQEVFMEVLEDHALAEAIQEGKTTELVSREEVFDIFEGKA